MISIPMRGAMLALLLTAAVAVPARGGIYFEQQVTSEGAGNDWKMVVRGWAEEGKAKVIYEQSSYPGLRKGSYLLTTDGGRTVHLVDPKARTYSSWDFAAMMGLMLRAGEMTGGLIKIDARDPAFEQLVSEPGPAILGRSTDHVRWKSGYTMDTKVLFKKMSHRSETTTDAWVTQDIHDPALLVWLKATPPTTGDPELDAILTGTADQVQGLALRMEQVTTTTSKKGRTTSATMRTEVTALREEEVDDAMFVFPAGYTEPPLFPSFAEPAP